MHIGALGDIHGDFASVRRIMARHQDVPWWVSVGDLAGPGGEYEAVPAPLYWIKGNNEDFDFVARASRAGTAPPVLNLYYVPNGVSLAIACGPGRRQGTTPPSRAGHMLCLAGLGGTFAPKWYETPAAALPAGRVARTGRGTTPGLPLDDKRRHFVKEEVEACKALRDVDLFLTHEAPRPFPVTGRRGRLDAGKTPINEALAAMRPRLHLFGHHHRVAAAVRQGVPSICLDVVARSYLLIDAESLAYERVET